MKPTAVLHQISKAGAVFHCCPYSTSTIASSSPAAACPAVEHSKDKHQSRSCLLTCRSCRHSAAAGLLQVRPYTHHEYDMG